MKIIQILNDSKNKHINRYVEELSLGIEKYTTNESVVYYLHDNLELDILPDSLNIINSFDCIFIHSLPKKDYKPILNKLIHNIQIYKVLFIHCHNIKELYNNFNISYLKTLVNMCNKIVIYYDAPKIYDEFIKLFGEDIIQKIIQLPLIYNIKYLDISINDKKNNISLLSDKGIISNYNIFIDMFEKLKDKYQFIWKIYGVEKNIQTLSYKKLFDCNITNYDTTIIDSSKINVYDSVDYDNYLDVIDTSFFICDFDNIKYLSYYLLDSIACTTIPIILENSAKQIYIAENQTLFDIKCCIYVNDNNYDEIQLLINRYTKSPNTYINQCIKNRKIIEQVLPAEKIINNLFDNINKEES